MRQDAGWICLHRRIRDHWIWTDPERLKWWLDLLLMATSREREVLHDSHKITLKPGQMIVSSSQLAIRWGRHITTVKRFLQLFEKEGMIKRERCNRLTIVLTICNYEYYQSEGNVQCNRLNNPQNDRLNNPQNDRIGNCTPYNNKNNTPPPRVHAHEGAEEKRIGEKSESRENVMKWGARATQDEELRELAEKILGGRAGWSDVVRVFGLEQIEKQYVYPTYASYKGHLINWVRKHHGEGETNHKRQTNDETRRDYEGRRRGGSAYSSRRPPEYRYDAEEARKSF